MVALLNVFLDCLGHFQTSSNNSHIQCIQVALKIDPLISLAVKGLTVELILADEELVVRFVYFLPFAAVLRLAFAIDTPQVKLLRL